MKRFGSGQSSIMNEHKTQDCVGLRPHSTPMFAPLSAPLNIAEFHYHSPPLTMEKAIWKISHLKDGAYYCYCAYVLRISRYWDFLSPMLSYKGIFLRDLKLSGESRS